MPHLSPMNWLLAPFMFLIFTLPLISAGLWWSQTPTFPDMNLQSSKILKNKWNWK